jgi:dTDP-4-amino-4,6-dideoxygalactose transaminase
VRREQISAPPRTPGHPCFPAFEALSWIAVSRLFLSPPHLSGAELDLLREAVESNWIAPLGPQVDAFEAELVAATGATDVLALSSGTAALHLALLVHGIGHGDEVACSDLTFAASANAIVYTGAVPFFVDCDESWLIDPNLLDEALEARTRAGGRVRAVISVDLYGRCCDYEQLTAVCSKHDVVLIQDAAESLGATYRGETAGCQASLAALSFNGNKIITTSGGGALAATDGELLAHARKLSTQAREPVPHYEHNEIGFNYRLSNLLAAVGRAQLAVLPERVAARQRINARYRSLLADVRGIAFMPEPDDGTSNCWLTCITVDKADFGADREEIRLALEAEDIEARPVWKPMHLQPVFAGHAMFGGDVSARLFALGLCLPSGSAMTDDDQDRVVTTLLALRRS